MARGKQLDLFLDESPQMPSNMRGVTPDQGQLSNPDVASAVTRAQNIVNQMKNNFGVLPDAANTPPKVKGRLL